MAAAQDNKTMSINEDSKESNNFFSHFTNFWQKFSPPFKQETKTAEQKEAEAILVPVVSTTNNNNKASKKKEVVKFSDPKPIVPPPLKLDVPDSDQNPAARYLVYAVGGFLAMRWIWARWQERKERSGKNDSNDNSESSPADEDDGYHSA